MFDIELSLPGSSSHTIILRRDYQEFRVLHLALTNLLTSSKVRGVGRSRSHTIRVLGFVYEREKAS